MYPSAIIISLPLLKKTLIFSDVIDQSQSLWSPGKWKKNSESKEESCSEAGMGCKLGTTVACSGGRLSTRVHCGWDGAQAGVGSGGFLGMSLVLEGRAGYLLHSPLSVCTILRVITSRSFQDLEV